MPTESDCLVCLLRGGLPEPGDNRESSGFGDFEIAEREDGSLWELGAGAMGVTYRAVDTVLHRTVALKVIEVPPTSGAPGAMRARFLREARASAALKHQNVAGIFQFGASPESGRCYYAMELVEGETLEALVRRDGPLPPAMALEVAIQATRALVAAAAQNLIHRDLKPGNIMIARSGLAMEVKVIDFGLAKVMNAVAETDLTHGGFIGTPAFASPEQFAGAPADARSDIYSLGATLWYALTGNVPYPGKTIAEIQEFQQTRPLPIEQLAQRDVPGRLLQLLQRALDRDPARRPASAQELLGRLEACRKGPVAPGAMSESGPRRKIAGLVAAGIVLAMIAFGFWLRREQTPPAAANEKSIAVLPFENLSDAKENAYFAGGVQDELLSDLAKIADLKVISRTSVERYQSGAPRDLPEIGRSLGVAKIVEGSVQRVGRRIRVVAQLIDARSDSHLWGETYDRDVSDIFAIQDEIAETIAHQLQAKIAPREDALIKEKPTTDLTAYAFYEQARNVDRNRRAYPEKRVPLLQEAIRRDPNFILAYCMLANAYATIYVDQTMDSGDARLESAAQARETIDTALRLRPDRGEPHLASANYFFIDYRFPEARRELDIALRLLPNDAEATFLNARLARHENRWTDALAEARRAAELDPENEFIVLWTSDTYLSMRLLGKGEEFIRQAKIRNPLSAKQYDEELARFKLAEGDLASAFALSRDPVSQLGLEAQFTAALFARNYSAALRTIATARPELVEEAFCLRSPNSIGEAVVYRALGKQEKAERIFRMLREEMDKHSTQAPRNEWYYKDCSQLDAALGRKEEAIREARQAVDMHSIARDPINGTAMALGLAQVYAWVGERDLAIEQLEILGRIPSDVNYGELRYNSRWDSLRDNPRFQKILASLEPERPDY